MRRLALAATAIALAGCGSDEAASTQTTAAPAATVNTQAPRPQSGLDPNLVAALGDSITAGSPLWDPDPAFRMQIAQGRASTETSQWEYWYQQAHPDTRFRNCGIFGQRTDEIAARLQQCEAGARTVVVQGGINDIAQGASVADAGKNLDAIVVKAQGDGRKVALVQVLPWNNGYPQAEQPIDELNGLIDAIGKRRSVPVYPWYGALEDPGMKGRMRADLTIDGDHPSVAGYKRLAGLVKLP